MSQYEPDIPQTESSDAVAADGFHADSVIDATVHVNTKTYAEVPVNTDAAKSNMPQLDVEWFSSQIFWLTLTFAFLYLLLSRSVLPRIHNVMENRQNKITHDIDRAEQLRNEAEEARETYERALKESRAKAQSLIAESAALMEKSAAARHAELDRKLETQLSDAEANIAAAKEDALAKLAPVSKELTRHIVEKLTGQKLQDKEIATVVDTLIKEKSHA